MSKAENTRNLRPTLLIGLVVGFENVCKGLFNLAARRPLNYSRNLGSFRYRSSVPSTFFSGLQKSVQLNEQFLSSLAINPLALGVGWETAKLDAHATQAYAFAYHLVLGWGLSLCTGCHASSYTWVVGTVEFDLHLHLNSNQLKLTFTSSGI